MAKGFAHPHGKHYYQKINPSNLKAYPADSPGYRRTSLSVAFHFRRFQVIIQSVRASLSLFKMSPITHLTQLRKLLRQGNKNTRLVLDLSRLIPCALISQHVLLKRYLGSSQPDRCYDDSTTVSILLSYIIYAGLSIAQTFV